MRFSPAGLAAARVAAGKSQYRLAKDIDRTPTMVNLYESGKNTPTVATLCRIVVALNCPLDQLFEEDKART